MLQDLLQKKLLLSQSPSQFDTPRPRAKSSILYSNDRGTFISDIGTESRSCCSWGRGGDDAEKTFGDCDVASDECWSGGREGEGGIHRFLTGLSGDGGTVDEERGDSYEND